MSVGQIIALTYLAGALYLTVKAIYTPERRVGLMVCLFGWAVLYLAITMNGV